MFMVPWGTNSATLGVGTDPDALLWKAAVVAAGGTVSDARRDGPVTKLYSDIRAAGLKSVLSRLSIYGGENSASALMDFISLTSSTLVNTPTVTVDRGIAGNATTSYVDTNFNLSTDLKFTQNSAHIADWQVSAGFSGALDAAAVNGTWLGGNNEINGTVASAVAFNDTTSSAFRGLSRSNSANFTRYFNGAPEATTASTSSAPVNLTYWLAGGRNFNGALNQANAAQFIFFSAGAGLSDAQMLALYNAVNTYKIAIGA